MTRLVAGSWLLLLASAFAVAGLLLLKISVRVEVDPFAEPFGEL